MPRASWRGFLRLSLVSCPIYLSPATIRSKPIRLHQVWQPAPVYMDEDDLPDRGGGQQGSAPSIRRLLADNGSPDGDQTPAATRITLRPHDPGTGEEIDKREVLKGYEYSSGALRCPLSSYRQEAPGRLWPPRSLIRETSAGQLARSGCVSWTR